MKKFTAKKIRALYLSKTARKLLEEEQKYANSLVLDGFKVVLFLLVDLEDNEDNWYIFREMHQGLYRSSAVGQPIFLRDKLAKEEYEELVRIWNLNNNSYKAK